jgi:hypothetical protein
LLGPLSTFWKLWNEIRMEWLKETKNVLELNFAPNSGLYFFRGLLGRSTALYFYKQLTTSLHKPRGNLLENLFSKKCELKNNLQLLERKFLSQTNTTPKNGILLSKLAHFQESSIFQ